MHRFLVRFSESETSNHTPSLAYFTTTTTAELKFSVHTGGEADVPATQADVWKDQKQMPPAMRVIPPPSQAFQGFAFHG
jgi:hypothetical protein